MDNNTANITNKVVIGLVVVAGIAYLGTKFKDSNARSAEALINNSPEASQADTMYQLLKPLGGGLMTWAENVDEKKVIEFAKGIKNLEKVLQYYAALSKGGSMLEDVRLALNEKEYAEFKNNLHVASAVIPSPVKKVYASQTTTAKLQLWEDYSFKKGVAQATKGELLGTTLKAVSYYSEGYKKEMKLYYIQGSGLYAGKKFYVLQSQVILK